MSLRRFITVQYLKWVFWILVSLRWISIVVESAGEDGFAWRTAVLETGELAWILLIFTIFISLLHKLFPRFWLFCNLLPLRKHTGIFAFLIAVSHGVFQFLRMGIARDVPAMIRTAFSTEDAMVLGSVSVLIMLPLFIMSADRIVARMGYRAWKRFQRVAHVAFIAAALHIALIGYFAGRGVEWGPIALLGVYGLGYAYLWIRRWLAGKQGH
ncbi:MAG: ferric reductase-like transmembrane domain-containing protein [Candidatus Peribacteraceae bacterium]|nr:ferric reductase-like transmembrane domain-containing protein [Candidatus Peribacteraceae bacterium]